jgi:predicted Zn finger-like uncharacterized protein
MALATTCPHCKTSFKVVADQLKLRRGLVRCGKCQDVFSGVDYLRYIDDPKPKFVADPKPEAKINAPTTPGLDDLKTAFFLPETIFNASILIDPMTIQAPVPAYIPSPLYAPSMAQTSAAQASSAQASDPLSPKATLSASESAPISAVEAAALKLSRIPQGLEIENPGEPVPVIDPNRYQSPDEDDHGIASHGEASAIDYRARAGRGAFWPVVFAVLVMCALVQGAIVARHQIAAQMPETRPYLQALSRPFGLQVELPRRFEALSIESFELQAGEAGANETQSFTAQALLRNQATYAVQWPAIELSLTDPSGQLLARKVLLASDYLSAADLTEPGFAARSEKTVRVRLSLNQLNPNGYSAVLFYP